MATVNFIIPYFGVFPNYFQLFLNSCEKNSEFNWTIITDNQSGYIFPRNVRTVHMSFSNMKSLVTRKFNFDVSFDRPYKLCDMKPMYGYIFEEYVEGFDFWGYCDVDVIWGNLKKYINKKAFQYDKMFTNGHMTVMKNTDYMNKIFMSKIGGKDLYKEVLQTNKPCNFDEDFLDIININTICRTQGVKIYDGVPIADIYTKSSDFRRVLPDGYEKKTRNYYFWNNGDLVRRVKKENGWISEEYMYIHLQKRKMNIKCNCFDNVYKIIPNEFSKLDIPIEMIGINDDRVKCKKINLHYFDIRYRNLKAKLRRGLSK